MIEYDVEEIIDKAYDAYPNSFTFIGYLTELEVELIEEWHCKVESELFCNGTKLYTIRKERDFGRPY